MRYNRIFLLLFATLTLLCACQHAQAANKAVDTRFTDSLTFLGDSITAHMESRADVRAAQIWASKARYLNLDSRITYAKIVAPDTGEEELIADVAARIRPPYLLVALGVDYGVYYYRNEPQTFAKYYEKLLDALSAASPDTKILLQSVLPVAESCKALTNEMIDRTNTVIREIAARRGLSYLDTQSVLRDENGFLRAEYCYSEDGIHLTAKAYTAILNYINAQAGEQGWTV